MEVISIFSATRFIFDDVPSSAFNLMIYNLDNKTGIQESSLGGAWSIVESRIPSSPFPIVFGAEYDEPLEFTITFGSKETFDRTILHEIAAWLSKPGIYRWLEILQPDLEDVRFKCYMTDMRLVTLENLPIAFTMECHCDCGYAHTYPRIIRKTISSAETFSILNDSGFHGYIHPLVTITPDSASSAIRIINESDENHETRFDDLSLGGSDVITIDSARKIISCTNGENLYSKFNMNFPRLIRGENVLTVSGKCSFSMEYELLRIVGS